MKTLSLLSLFSICIIGNAQYVKLFDFAGTSNGKLPSADLFSDGVFLYGTTSAGGTSSLGVVFKIKPDGSGYSKLTDFTGTANGSLPGGSLISDGTFLYGTAYQGGLNNMGIIFKIKPDGSSFSNLLDFAGALNGKYPAGSLLFDGTFLYGMTLNGGLNDLGVIFKIKPDGTSYTTLLDFTGVSNGANPNGSLITDGIFLYGMSAKGGIDNLGVIFKIKPDGTGYIKLAEFTNSALNGASPLGSLTYDGTFLYGMTSQGGNGANGSGNIFKIKTDGTGFASLFNFQTLSSGKRPSGSLVTDGTYLYGMTKYGGANCSLNGSLGCGVIFRIKQDGTQFSKLLEFDGPSYGSDPIGSLISDGSFLYGLTSFGGANNMGAVFKIGINTVAVGIPENKTESDISIFPNPFSSQLTIQSINQFHETDLTIYNSMGQIVREVKNISGQSMTVSRDGLTNGIYFLQITEENKPVLSEKIILVD